MNSLKITSIKRNERPMIILKGKNEESDDEFRRNAPEVLDAPSAARFIGVCESTILDLASRAEVPCKRIGRRIIFGRRALVDWVNKG